MATDNDQQAFPNLQGAEFMLLTTYKRDTKPVPTTVWFAQVGDKLYVTTMSSSGKAKRIRATPQVTVEPSTRTGDSLGATAPAQAYIIADSEANDAKTALFAKYPEAEHIFQQSDARVAAQPDAQRIFIAVTPAAS